MALVKSTIADSYFPVCAFTSPELKAFSKVSWAFPNEERSTSPSKELNEISFFKEGFTFGFNLTDIFK
jgi:hypothetical protein